MMKRFSVLLTTDLHLSEKPDDQYRFGLFDWIVASYKDRLRRVVITGDLTDMKDRHADWFVNKIVDHIKMLAEHFEVVLLKGNHDYYNDPNSPFFKFLDDLDNVRYIVEPCRIGDAVFLPHTRKPKRDWTKLMKPGKILSKGSGNPSVIFCHQTFRGAKSETGFELNGISANFFKDFGCPVYSGDVHVPQKCGVVTYIGCPYHVHFGDTFKPRVLLLDSRKRATSVRFPAPRKMSIHIKDPQELLTHKPSIRKGDQVKVQLHLPRADFVSWPDRREEIKKIVGELEAKLYSTTLKEIDQDKRKVKKTARTKVRSHEQSFELFCRQRGVKGNARDVGLTLLR